MAYTISTFGAGQLSAYGADRPLLLGDNACEHVTAAAVWRTHAAGNAWFSWADTDATNASYPTSRAHDRFLHVPTQPTDLTVTQYGLMFDLAAATQIDCLVIAGHNFASLQGNVTVRIYVADDNAFTVNRAVIQTWTTFPKRLTQFNIGAAAQQYFQVRWLQISIVSDATLTTMPQIGEAWFGPRRQLSRNPNAPWDDKHWVSDVADFQSDSGVKSRYVRSTGQRIWTPTWTPTGVDTYGLDDVSTLQTWFTSDVAYGSKPCLFTPKPLSEAANTHLIYAAPEMDMRIEAGPSERSVSFRFEETAPFVATE